MTVRDAAAVLEAEIISEGNQDCVLTGGLVTDVMSGALAGGFRGMAWMTCRADINALAVAVTTNAGCLILTGSAAPSDETAVRARSEGVAVMRTDMPAFEAAGRLYAAGLRGGDKRYADA